MPSGILLQIPLIKVSRVLQQFICVCNIFWLYLDVRSDGRDCIILGHFCGLSFRAFFFVLFLSSSMCDVLMRFSTDIYVFNFAMFQGVTNLIHVFYFAMFRYLIDLYHLHSKEGISFSPQERRDHS